MRADYSNTMHNFGALAFTSAIQRHCKKPTRQLMLGRKCAASDVTVLNYTTIGHYFDKNHLDDVSEEMYRRYSKIRVALYPVNKSSLPPKRGPRSAKSLYVRAAKSFCPISFSLGGGEF